MDTTKEFLTITRGKKAGLIIILGLQIFDRSDYYNLIIKSQLRILFEAILLQARNHFSCANGVDVEVLMTAKQSREQRHFMALQRCQLINGITF